MNLSVLIVPQDEFKLLHRKFFSSTYIMSHFVFKPIDPMKYKKDPKGIG